MFDPTTVAFYLSRSSSLAETLAKMISSERKRRLSYKNDIETQLPFGVGSAMEGSPPTTEVNNIGGVSEEAFGLERKDLEGTFRCRFPLKARDPLASLTSSFFFASRLSRAAHGARGRS